MRRLVLADHPQRSQLRPSKSVSVVASVIALCIMGDSLMYSILPLEAAALGITLPQVGILLSVNRFIRLLSNRWAGEAFERFGPSAPFLVSVALGLLSTAVYGVRPGFAVFLVARISWGISWSGLRQGGYVSTWSGSPSIRGGLTGLLLGIVRVGSAVGVVLGGFLYDRVGFTFAVGTLLTVGLLALPISFAIPWQRQRSDIGQTTPGAEVKRKQSWREFAATAFGVPLHRWLTLSAIFVYLLGGIVVSTTSLFITTQITDDPSVVVFGIGVATLTGLLHGTRWMTNIVFGPLIGALSDRLGKSNTLLGLSLLMMVALTGVSLITTTLAILLLLVILLLDGSLTVVVNATASTIATDYERPHSFMASFATLADFGSAFGPIVAFSVFASARLPSVYLITGAILLFCLFKFWLADHNRRPLGS